MSMALCASHRSENLEQVEQAMQEAGLGVVPNAIRCAGGRVIQPLCEAIQTIMHLVHFAVVVRVRRRRQQRQQVRMPDTPVSIIFARPFVRRLSLHPARSVTADRGKTRTSHSSLSVETDRLFAEEPRPADFHDFMRPYDTY
jgi:hypothetical protein